MNNMKSVPYTLEIQRSLSSTFNCGNTTLDSFLRRPESLDDNEGKTYVIINEDEPKCIIGYYNIGAGHIDMRKDGKIIKAGGSVHINYLALDVKYQRTPVVTDSKYKMYLSDLLMLDCLNRIKYIRDNHIGFTFVTLCATEEGKNLYQRNGFEELEHDMVFNKDEAEVLCTPMYYAMDVE